MARHRVTLAQGWSTADAGRLELTMR